MGQPTTTGAESVYFAQPYSLDATGFYFRSLADYRAQVAQCRDAFGRPVEEFEIQYIDGDLHALFAALAVNQATLAEWFETYATFDPDSDRTIIFIWLLEQGYDVSDALEACDDFSLFAGTAADYARTLVEDCVELTDWVSRYLDYEALGRDMVLGGSIHELDHRRLIVGTL